MPIPRWNVTQEMSTVHMTQVFSGGACNILDAEGNLLRNAERDSINDWLTQRHIVFFDPQIHPDTHGIEYDYNLHHRLELAARKAAKINLYEVSPRTFGGITSCEIAIDSFRWSEPTVIYFSDGDPSQDKIPTHSERGYPLFMPDSIQTSPTAMQAHYKEFIKNANHMRRYVLRFAQEMDSLTITFGEKAYDGDVIITPERMHAAEIFQAIVRAGSGQRVIVNFSGGSTTRDEHGTPIFIAPAAPPEIEMRALLDQYVDEGNALRKEIAQLIRVNVFTRVVFTEKSAILALEELLNIK